MHEKPVSGPKRSHAELPGTGLQAATPRVQQMPKGVSREKGIRGRNGRQRGLHDWTRSENDTLGWRLAISNRQRA
jgi:hypothetical protein